MRAVCNPDAESSARDSAGKEKGDSAGKDKKVNLGDNTYKGTI